ncbi:RND family efflux transporter, MFP subunit [Reichenbachiella faecimaris]|uniref:RND family efflux transporter, MFP subunit n=1 Tax=Reichenbachiella faecimaris TaxID=692418 RepID=A0A1W2G7R4_REIFA|nr:efflux RND transporter periplasmic adaptor subunit [Reichenbachiella faecimaris]SMD32641.1 RND family efflux transporter, MFP subunit [Reichenbachiella faecimaris]
MRRKLVSYAVVLLILVATYFAYQALSSQNVEPPQRPKPVAKNYVAAKPFEPQTVETTIEAFGRVGSAEQINVIAEVGGKLLHGSSVLKKGHRFRKGQLLCRIDDIEENLDLQARKSSFLHTLASILPDIRIDFPNSFSEWQSYFDGIKLDEKLPALPEAKSSKEKTFLAAKNILSEFYAIKSAEENLKKFYIYAPFNGSIVSINYQIGSVVNPGANIGTIISTDELELEIPVEQRDIEFVQKGKAVTIVDESDFEQNWIGTITRIADFIDPNSQSVSVFINIQKRSKYEALDGLFLKARIPGKSVKNAAEVPRRILKNKNEIFVVQDSVLVTRQVRVHKISENNAIISGLKSGEMMVTDRPSNASENMKVEIIKPKS